MIDVRMFTVGPVQENCFIVRRDGRRAGADRRPGDEADRLLDAIDELGIETVEAILRHPHPLRPRRRGGAGGAGDRGARLLPRARAPGAGRTSWTTCRGRGSARSRAMRPTTRSPAARRSSWPASTIDVIGSRPGHSPGHVTYAIAGEDALFSGDVLFQGSVGRVDLPGGDWPTLLASIESLVDEFPPETTVYPGAHGDHHARPRARDEPVPARARHEPVIQAPKRHVRRPPGRRGCAASALEREAARILGARGLPADRDAGVRGHRAVRPRGGGGHRHRAEGDVHVRRRRRALADAAPGGHRAGLPRLHRARHAQAAPAGQALVPVELLPRRGARSAAATASSGRSAPRRSARPRPRPTPS